ncbi:DUF2459 domain-containing protein [Microvirga terricola]|uniref:DUF2459 domain-containing protein n=1 Tax=Microvirga terricola TaxID=2719797 RepID=A0ABX0VD15_9HYPH|nr:DUF2459 domain-containing protein [Microvirga terricola]NIX77738.1 DUF2459 domain-containing protein [Microvirga terricola]
MRRAFRTLLKGSLALLFLVSAAIIWTARPGNPALFPAGEDGIDVVLVSNGYHAGLVVPLRSVAEIASRDGMAGVLPVATRFRQFDWIEVGWGDDDVYRSTPTAASLQMTLAARALLGLGNGSVLHVVGIAGVPESVFAGADVTRIRLSKAGFERVVARIDQSFALSTGCQPEILGPGLYGPSLFYRAVGDFSAFRVCNHWIADLLDAAGIPTTPAAAILPFGIRTDLKWRSRF